MKKSKALSPYVDGRPRFKTRKRPGVYIIYRKGTPVYIGYSGSDVYKTMYRHFQRWNDKTQTRVTYVPSDDQLRVRVIYTATPQQASRLEYALIVKYQPKDNPTLYFPDNFNSAPVQKDLNTFDGIYTFDGADPF